jgi:signal transduction histidine kinase/CheY-like chemotaxis protein/HPt (histidine-containing phosphotransfer) domain-containing protein
MCLCSHKVNLVNTKGFPVASTSNTHLGNYSPLLNALQATKQALAVVDSAGKVQWCSERFSALVVAKGDGINQSIFDCLRQRSCSPQSINQLTEALKCLKSDEFNLSLADDNGVPAIFAVDISPVNPESLVATEFCVSLTDVSELESLRVSVERTREQSNILFECVRAGKGEWQLLEGLISLGPRLAMMIGDQPTAWMKRPANDLLDRCHPEDAPHLKMQIEELIERRLERIHTEFRVKHEEGYWVAFLARGQVDARNEKGAPANISFVFIDVTDLRHQDSRWKHRAQLSSDWFWATDEKGNLSEISKEVAGLINGSLDDLLYKPLLEVLRLIGATPLDTLDMTQFGQRRVVKGRVVRLERAGLPTAWYELDATPRYDFRGEFIGYEGVGRNVTKRQMQELEVLEAKQIAEHSNKSKSVFLATMSHEIRTPMNGVLGMAEMLSTSVLDEEQAESVAIIRQSATHLLSLIDSILDFSKLEADRVEIEERQVHVDDVIYSLTDSLLPVAQAKGVQLRAFVDPNLPTLSLDDTRLRQVLNNFVGNAIKFSSSDEGNSGQVYLRAESNGSGLLKISVSDNGIGIAEEQVRSIFEAFTQAEVSTTRRFGGTGLGLAISKKLIELMGGMINVESKLGRGAVFTILLPMKVIAETSVKHKELAAKHCIVVGPDSQENKDLQFMLRNSGASAFLVGDMSAAFNAMNSVMRPTVYLHTAIENSEIAYAKALQSFEWAKEVSHLLVTDGTRKSLRMIEENIACVDWGRSAALVTAVSLMTQDRSQIPSSAGAAKKRLIGMGLPKSVQKLSASIKVLVAEDDPINQRVISRQLAHLGVQCDITQTGREALEMWMEDKHYSLILTDLHMPVMDGYELTRRIRSLESDNEHIPIVALTANAVTGETFEAYKAGIDLYLTKPILLADLSMAIATFAQDVGGKHVESDVSLATPMASTSFTEFADFDLQTVIGILGDDQALIRDLTDQYSNDLERVLNELFDALKKQDAKQSKFLAHRLKSSSRSVGALKLGKFFCDLENTPLVDSFEDTKATLETIFKAYKDSVLSAFPEMQSK